MFTPPPSLPASAPSALKPYSLVKSFEWSSGFANTLTFIVGQALFVVERGYTLRTPPYNLYVRVRISDDVGDEGAAVAVWEEGGRS